MMVSPSWLSECRSGANEAQTRDRKNHFDRGHAGSLPVTRWIVTNRQGGTTAPSTIFSRGFRPNHFRPQTGFVGLDTLTATRFKHCDVVKAAFVPGGPRPTSGRQFRRKLPVRCNEFADLRGGEVSGNRRHFRFDRNSPEIATMQRPTTVRIMNTVSSEWRERVHETWR